MNIKHFLFVFSNANLIRGVKLNEVSISNIAKILISDNDPENWEGILWRRKMSHKLTKKAMNLVTKTDHNQMF